MRYVAVVGLALGLMWPTVAASQSINGTVDAGVAPTQQISNGASSGVNSAIDSNINGTNTNTNNNQSGATNNNDINTNSTLNNSINNDSRVLNNSTMIQDGRVQSGGTVYDGRIINDNRQITIDSPNQNQGTSEALVSPDSPFLTQFPNIIPAQPSNYGLGPGISCPGPTVAVNSYARQGSGYRSEYGGTASITIPIGGGSAATCETAGQKYVEVLDAQRQLYQSQAQMFQNQAEWYRAQMEKLNAELQNLKLQNAANALKLKQSQANSSPSASPASSAPPARRRSPRR